MVTHLITFATKPGHQFIERVESLYYAIVIMALNTSFFEISPIDLFVYFEEKSYIKQPV